MCTRFWFFLSLRPRIPWTSHKLRKHHNIVIHIRSLQILLSMFHNASTNYFIPIQFIVSRSIIGIMFSIIKYKREMHPLITLIMFCVMGIQNLLIISLLTIFSGVQILSKKCILSWKGRHWQHQDKGEDEEYFRRFIASYKPCGIRYGMFYCVKPKTLLMFLISIARGTVRMLIAVEKHVN